MASAPNKRTSSASAGLFLAQGRQSASIISISWTLAWQVPQTSEHHQHQLGCFLHRGTRSDSIISITWTLAWQVQHNTEHHQHQLGCFLHRRTEPASIISIRTLRELPIGSLPNKPTSSASAGRLLAQGTKSASSISIRWTLAWQGPQTSEHHRHQLGCFLHRRTASWTFAWLVHQASEHHQHQLDSRLGRCPKQANIISISRAASAPNQPASSASGRLSLGRCSKQPNISISSACFLYKGTKSASISIISISWAASCTGAPNQPASSASAGLSLGRCPKQANIISISWAASCTSLASAGLSLGRCTKQANIISISWAGSSRLAGAPNKRASSASARSCTGARHQPASSASGGPNK